ncbi:MAG: DUF5615 family PIN-like protein [Nitrososphaera sp.]|jgi:uncharacterized protein YaiI (UPF0178 family)
MIDEILCLVNGRSVIVDACVSREIVRKLADRGIKARHVTDMDPKMTDDEIAQIMLPDDVLITKDVDFARTLRERAILLPHMQQSGVNAAGLEKKKKLPKIKLSKEVKAAAKDSIAREMTLGILHLKILCGVFMVFDMRVLSVEEVKEIYRFVRIAAT